MDDNRNAENSCRQKRREGSVAALAEDHVRIKVEDLDNRSENPPPSFEEVEEMLKKVQARFRAAHLAGAVLPVLDAMLKERSRVVRRGRHVEKLERKE